jgi:hypothetical protein
MSTGISPELPERSNYQSLAEICSNTSVSTNYNNETTAESLLNAHGIVDARLLTAHLRKIRTRQRAGPGGRQMAWHLARAYGMPSAAIAEVDDFMRSRSVRGWPGHSSALPAPRRSTATVRTRVACRAHDLALLMQKRTRQCSCRVRRGEQNEPYAQSAHQMVFFVRGFTFVNGQARGCVPLDVKNRPRAAGSPRHALAGRGAVGPGR